MGMSKLLWDENERKPRAVFNIANVGSLNLEVDAELTWISPQANPEEKRALALRHAKLLVRNLANELERQSAR